MCSTGWIANDSLCHSIPSFIVSSKGASHRRVVLPHQKYYNLEFNPLLFMLLAVACELETVWQVGIRVAPIPAEHQ